MTRIDNAVNWVLIGLVAAILLFGLFQSIRNLLA
jgi:uncharacterized membrane protein